MKEWPALWVSVVARDGSQVGAEQSTLQNNYLCAPHCVGGALHYDMRPCMDSMRGERGGGRGYAMSAGQGTCHRC